MVVVDELAVSCMYGHSSLFPLTDLTSGAGVIIAVFSRNGDPGAPRCDAGHCDCCRALEADVRAWWFWNVSSTK